jgi:hypothetical protein
MRIHLFRIVAASVVCLCAGLAEAQPSNRDEDGWAKVSAGRAFSLRAPAGTVFKQEQGIDSFVGEFHGPGFWMTFDFGIYSYDFPDERKDPRYAAEKTLIDGKDAIIFVGPGQATCKGHGDTMVAMYVAGIGTGPFGHANALSIWTCVGEVAEIPVVKEIYHTMKFPA